MMLEPIKFSDLFNGVAYTILLRKAFRYTGILMVVVLLISCSKNKNMELEPELEVVQVDTSILVGTAYFAGWHEEDPTEDKWKMYQHGVDFTTLPDYSGRKPLLGHYNIQATMDQEIDAASAYGIDFFSILWYYWNNAKESERAGIQRLNRGLEQYQLSPNRNKMKFMMEACNADRELSITTELGWDSVATVFVNAAKDSSYLRIDGRPVFKIHDGSRFYTQLNSDINLCKSVIQNFRTRAKDAGIGEILIAIGTYGEEGIHANSLYTQYGVDLTMHYSGIPESHLIPKSHYPYSQLSKYPQALRSIRENDALPWVPFAMSGWDALPWGGEGRSTFDFPTREQWNKTLTDMKSDLLASTNFGFPKKDGSLQKAFTIFAWNEYGEGGMIAPTQDDQYMKLEEIKKVFGN